MNRRHPWTSRSSTSRLKNSKRPSPRVVAKRPNTSTKERVSSSGGVKFFKCAKMPVVNLVDLTFLTHLNLEPRS